VLTIARKLHTIVNDGLSRRRPLIARDGIAHRLPGVMDAQPGEEPGRRWIPVPQPLPCAAAASRSLPNTTSRVPVIPACAGGLSWRCQVAEGSPSAVRSPSSPWPRWPVPRLWLACLRSSFIPVSVVALCPKTGLWQATHAHRTKPVGARTLKSGMGRMQTHSLCVTRRATRHRRSMPCPARIGAMFRCSRHAHGAGCAMREERDVLSDSACVGTTRAARRLR
jgi:hypothetical protein